MIQRPCHPDTDLKRLWHVLLPGTPLPACGGESQGDDGGAADMPQSRSSGGTGLPPAHPTGLCAVLFDRGRSVWKKLRPANFLSSRL
jgi:hypothetical protein